MLAYYWNLRWNRPGQPIPLTFSGGPYAQKRNAAATLRRARKHLLSQHRRIIAAAIKSASCLEGQTTIDNPNKTKP